MARSKRHGSGFGAGNSGKFLPERGVFTNTNKTYFLVEKNSTLIIDLQKTVGKVDEAYNFLREVASQGEVILFVGTKKQAQEAIKEEALRANMFFVNERWLGGMLTNFKTIETRVKRLKQLEKMAEDGTF